MRRESVSTYPHRPKAEAFSNVVDVVERLRDPTDPSTERTAPPRSAHVQLDDVPRALNPVEDKGGGSTPLSFSYSSSLSPFATPEKKRGRGILL